MWSVLLCQTRPQKKIVEFCHVTSVDDVVYPTVIQKHINEMEKRPFDGLIFRLRNYNHMSDPRLWDKDDVKLQIDTLRMIKWGRFTDNFLFLYVTDKWDMNWFNDDQWDNILHNMILISKAAKAGNCAGICLDVEPYGDGIFQYPGPKAKYASKSFTEVSAKVRQRGMEFMKALQTEMPKMKLLQFFQMAVYESLFDIVNLQEREEKLYTHTSTSPRLNSTYYNPWYTNLSLAYPFFLGMLEGAGPGITFIDGNEGSYYYEEPEQFYRAYHTIKNRALTMIPDELKTKYKTQVDVGSSVYMNQMLGRYRGSAVYMSPEQRLKLFEHNLYYALQTSDEYVWFYSDWPLTWWNDFLPGKRGIPLPEETEEAMRSAITKYNTGKPLGFDLTSEISMAKEKAKTNTK